jgi:hypothetical protein
VPTIRTFEQICIIDIPSLIVAGWWSLGLDGLSGMAKIVENFPGCTDFQI